MYFFCSKLAKDHKIEYLVVLFAKSVTKPCVDMSRAFQYQILGNSVVKPGYRSRNCTFFSKMAKKSQNELFFVLYDKGVINPCVDMSRALLFQILGNLVVKSG